MALVIFCVALVEARRTRMSLRLGMAPWSASGERLGVGFDRTLELRGRGIPEIAGITDFIEKVGMPPAHGPEQPILERPHPIDRNWIKIAVDARIDDADL